MLLADESVGPLEVHFVLFRDSGQIDEDEVAMDGDFEARDDEREGPVNKTVLQIRLAKKS